MIVALQLHSPAAAAVGAGEAEAAAEAEAEAGTCKSVSVHMATDQIGDPYPICVPDFGSKAAAIAYDLHAIGSETCFPVIRGAEIEGGFPGLGS